MFSLAQIYLEKLFRQQLGNLFRVKAEPLWKNGVEVVERQSRAHYDEVPTIECGILAPQTNRSQSTTLLSSSTKRQSLLFVSPAGRDIPLAYTLPIQELSSTFFERNAKHEESCFITTGSGVSSGRSCIRYEVRHRQWQ